MKQRIERLRKLSRSLEPGPDERAAWTAKVFDHASEFIESLRTRPAYGFEGNEGRGLLDSPISEDPIDIESAIGLLRDHVEKPGVKLGSPGYLAFIPISSLYPGALGDYLASVINPYSGNFFASPGAVRLENQTVRWMADFVGYPATAAGNLTSGGSISNLIGIVTAREAHGIKARHIPKTVVYLTEQAHHSVAKALRIAGLGECVQRKVPLDERYRMRADALKKNIRNDRAAGLNPWLIAATAGTTDTGAVDPLPEIAEVARKNKLWLHTDGTYGAMFALCPPGRKILKGLELADSLSLDPHKGLFMPCGLGGVLVKDGQALWKAHRYEAHYMRDREALASLDETSPSELSPELTRPFRALPLWLALKLIGVKPFRAAIEEKLLLARYLYERVRKLKGFAAGPPPDLSIVTFRYLPRRGDANDFNQRLLSSVQRDGRVFITSTRIDGNLTLRVAILCPATHIETIDLTLKILKDKAAEIGG